jgi:hypothetical protein
MHPRHARRQETLSRHNIDAQAPRESLFVSFLLSEGLSEGSVNLRGVVFFV